MNHKKHLPVVLFATAAILLVAIFIQTPNDVRGPESGEDDQTVGDEMKSAHQNFNTIHPADWSETEQAEQSINRSQEKPVGDADLGEKITYGVVEDPTEEGIFYFATYELVGSRTASDEIEDTTNRFIGIYRYEAATRSWERLYRRIEEANIESDSKYFVLGYDDGLILRRAMADSLASTTCVDAWTLGSERQDVAGNVYIGKLEWMDIAEPYNQWRPYEVPSDTIIHTTCLSSVK